MPTPADALLALETLAARRWSLRLVAGGCVVDDERGNRVYPVDGVAPDPALAVIDGAADYDARTVAAEDQRADRLLRSLEIGHHPRPRRVPGPQGGQLLVWDLYDVAGVELSRDHGSARQALRAAPRER